MKTKFDIFICYRRVDPEGHTSGRDIARNIKLKLENKGFRIFFVNDGLIEHSDFLLIQSAITYSRNFIVLLSKGFFDDCSNPDNIIRTEIECAIKAGCNIIPIDIDNQFDGFPSSLPASLEMLTRLQIFEVSMDNLFQTCIDFLEKSVLIEDNSNAWVFVSHSNKDFEKIIKIRNKLEKLRYKPLLFFLKCLEDDAEVFELIKREIKARDRFILCDSPNSRSSKWVQKEIEFIKSLHRPYEIINLDAEESEINECIERFDRRSSVYIWSTSDDIADNLLNELIEKAFKVGILPSTYLNDYLDFKRGFPVKDFKEIDNNAYIATIIDRELTKNEMQVLDSCSDYFRSADGDAFLLYVVSQNDEERCSLIKKNMEFLKEMYRGNGIQTRYITSMGLKSQAKLIMQNIMELDNYHNTKQ
jgi:hypothetical protein